MIIDALKAASGKIAGKGGAAERLALKRTTLQNIMLRLSISRGDYSRVPNSPSTFPLNRAGATSAGDA